MTTDRSIVGKGLLPSRRITREYAHTPPRADTIVGFPEDLSSDLTRDALRPRPLPQRLDPCRCPELKALACPLKARKSPECPGPLCRCEDVRGLPCPSCVAWQKSQGLHDRLLASRHTRCEPGRAVSLVRGPHSTQLMFSCCDKRYPHRTMFTQHLERHHGLHARTAQAILRRLARGEEGFTIDLARWTAPGRGRAPRTPPATPLPRGNRSS